MKETTNIEERLIASFRELVMTEPVEKITIKEIADGAGVIRTTFYYHFQDKYELIERIIRDNLIAPLEDLLQQHRVNDSFLEILIRLDEDRAFYRRLAKMEGQNSFEELLMQSLSAMLQEEIRLLGPLEDGFLNHKKYPWMTEKFVADYYAQTITFTLITFLNTDPPATPQEASEVFNYVVRHSVNEILLDWYWKKQPAHMRDGT